jgi:DNA repair protein RecN
MKIYNRAVLVELMVENYAVIERIRVRLHAGLNVLTGETGSGKSIVVDALGLLFGGRASADMLRSGSDRARVSGIFEFPAGAAGLLAAAGIEAEENELLVEREILASGKSRAFVANRPATAALLRELAPHLGDIHGQHEQQQLFSPDAQLAIVDTFAGNQALLLETGGVYRDWKACVRELEEIDRGEQEKLRMLDLWSFQAKEIAAAHLKPGEDSDLENERRIQMNVAKLSESAGTAYSALYDDESSVFAQMRVAARRIEELCRIDESLQPVLETLKPAQIAVDEASSAIRDYLGKLEADPERLEEIETRLALIGKLKRKYGATVEEILAFLEEVTANIKATESASDRRQALQKRQSELVGAYQALAAKLTARRTESARKLEKRVMTELKSLAMERTVFQVQISKSDWTSAGEDSLTFLVSPNVGEEPRPLDKVASGGELSRIALALKTCVTGQTLPRTLVFDEVDAGIGGAAVEMVGRRLKQLAAANQVLCVTHLAQIAGFGDHHYSVEKRESRGRTVAAIEELQGEARTREIGRMLSGQHLTPEALKHAEQLIRSNTGDA